MRCKVAFIFSVNDKAKSLLQWRRLTILPFRKSAHISSLSSVVATYRSHRFLRFQRLMQTMTKEIQIDSLLRFEAMFHKSEYACFENGRSIVQYLLLSQGNETTNLVLHESLLRYIYRRFLLRRQQRLFQQHLPCE